MPLQGPNARNRKGGRVWELLLLCGSGRDWFCPCMSEAAGVQVLRQLPPLSLAQGTLVLRLCPSGGLFPINDFIQRFHSHPRHHNHLTENDSPVYMCSLAFRRFSLLASSYYCPVLICHVNNNCKYAVVSWQTVYSSGMLEQFYRIVTVTALLPLRDLSQCAGQLTPQCHCNHKQPVYNGTHHVLPKPSPSGLFCLCQ